MERVALNSKLKKLVYDGAYKKYGKLLPEDIEIRIEKELKYIIDNKLAEIYLIAYKLVNIVKKDGYIVGNRGSIGSSVVAYCLDITEVDPIRYNIQFEIFAGIYGNKRPYIKISVPFEYVYNKIENQNIIIIRGDFRTSIIYNLKLLTGVSPTTILLDDKETLEFICSGHMKEVVELSNSSEIILQIKPTTFEELIKIYGIAHGKRNWENNVKMLIQDGTATLSEVISCQDDILDYLVSQEMEKHTAYEIMKYVIKPKRNNQWNKYKDIMKKHNIPEWYINSCEKMDYLYPKAEIVSDLIIDYRLVWYKVHYPNEYDKAFKNLVNKNYKDVTE